MIQPTIPSVIGTAIMDPRVVPPELRIATIKMDEAMVLDTDFLRIPKNKGRRKPPCDKAV